MSPQKPKISKQASVQHIVHVREPGQFRRNAMTVLQKQESIY